MHESINYTYVFVGLAKNVFFGVLQNFSNYFMCAMR